MKKRFILALFFFGSLMPFSVSFADCSVSDAAYRLSQASDRFAYLVRYTAGYTQLETLGRRLFDESDRLRYLAERGESAYELQRQYRYVESSFYNLRSGYDYARRRTPNQNVDRSWAQVNFTFYELNRAIQSSGGRTYTINCASSRYRYQECPVSGDVLAVRLAQQQSSATCQQGTSWGYYARAIWVDHGCRANFWVTIR